MMTMKLLKVLPFLLIWGVWNRTRMFEVALNHCWSYLRYLEAQKTRSHLVVWADNKLQAHIAGSWQPLLAERAQAIQAVPYFVHSGKQPWCLVAPWSCNYLKQFESLTRKTIESKHFLRKFVIYEAAPSILFRRNILPCVCIGSSVFLIFLLFLRQDLMTYSPRLLSCMVYWAALGSSPWAELERIWAGLPASTAQPEEALSPWLPAVPGLWEWIHLNV